MFARSLRAPITAAAIALNLSGCNFNQDSERPTESLPNATAGIEPEKEISQRPLTDIFSEVETLMTSAIEPLLDKQRALRDSGTFDESSDYLERGTAIGQLLEARDALAELANTSSEVPRDSSFYGLVERRQLYQIREVIEDSISLLPERDFNERNQLMAVVERITADILPQFHRTRTEPSTDEQGSKSPNSGLLVEPSIAGAMVESSRLAAEMAESMHPSEIAGGLELKTFPNVRDLIDEPAIAPLDSSTPSHSRPQFKHD